MQGPDEARSSDDLVTGEAVVLDLPAATVGVRVASGLIDVLLQVLVLAALLVVALVAVSSSDDALRRVATVGATVGVLVALPTAVETVTRGRSRSTFAWSRRPTRT